MAEVGPRFLSVAVDSAQLVGGGWWSPDGRVDNGGGQTPQPRIDFSRPRLRRLAAPLAPAYLRLGGSEADKIFYAVGPDRAVQSPPGRYRRLLDEAQWAAAAGFARSLGFELMFTLNAGPGPRGPGGAWTSTNAASLVAHATAREDPVAVWELGNEVNAFQVIHGLFFKVGAARYAQDVRTARAMLDEVGAEGRLAAPASAYWPEIGEAPDFYPRFMRRAGSVLDLVTWHYYPMQSRRCPLRTVPATDEAARAPSVLDEVEIWAAEVESVRDDHAPGVPVWLGETGHAQCGGEPGLSDRFESGFWWLDQLGLMARRGQPVVVRQSLTGADYGLLSEPDLEPRPDYFASVLWKRLMGSTVLGLDLGRERTLRAYAHCAAGVEGGVTVVLVNPDPERGAFAQLEGLSAARARAYRLQAVDGGRASTLGGRPLAVEDDGALPPMTGVLERLDPSSPELYLPASSYGFFVLEDAEHPACSSS